MEGSTKEEITLRIEKLKSRVNEINDKLKKYNCEIDNSYEFAEKIGVKRKDKIYTKEVSDELQRYIDKAEEIKENIVKKEENEEEIQILNNMIYLDDVRFGSISELIEESKEITNKEYINAIGERANNLIREEELSKIDKEIEKLSKNSIIDKITRRDKVKKALLENYSLRRNEVMNKKYIPNDKTILEILDITKKCGYKSYDIDEFIDKLSKKYDIELQNDEKALEVIKKENKVPLFYSKSFIEKITKENDEMMGKIEESRQKDKAYSEFKFSEETLKNGISSLELFEYNNVTNEVK